MDGMEKDEFGQEMGVSHEVFNRHFLLDMVLIRSYFWAPMIKIVHPDF